MASHGAPTLLFLQVVCHEVLMVIVKLQKVATFRLLWAQFAVSVNK